MKDVRSLCQHIYKHFSGQNKMLFAYEALAGGAHIDAEDFEKELRFWGNPSDDLLQDALKMREEIFERRLSNDSDLKALMKEEQTRGAPDTQARIALYRKKIEEGKKEAAAQALVGGRIEQSSLGQWNHLAQDRESFAGWMKELVLNGISAAFAQPEGKYEQVSREPCTYKHKCDVDGCYEAGVNCSHTKHLPDLTPLEVLWKAQVKASLEIQNCRTHGTERGRFNHVLFDLYRKEIELLKNKKNRYTDDVLEELMVSRLVLAQLMKPEHRDGILLGGVVLTKNDERYVREWFHRNKTLISGAVEKAIDEYAAGGESPFISRLHHALSQETRLAAEGAIKRYSSSSTAALRKLAHELGIDSQKQRRQELELFRGLHKKYVPGLRYDDQDDEADKKEKEKKSLNLRAN